MLEVPKQQATASHWGIDPVPPQHRTFSGIDLGILWGDLGIGLLVIVAGALLVAPPEQLGFGLSLPSALVAIILGSLIGSALLGVGGVIGTREGKPTMALLRPVLGTKGSWIPSLLNVAQLIGWTAFELWAMALVADRLGARLFGFSSFAVWLVVFTAVVLGLALWGPLGVVRIWMERFGAWLVLAIGLALSAYLVVSSDLGKLFSGSGAGGSRIFGAPMDIVIALPVSWIPLVADYNRFGSHARSSFWGTFGGFAFANAWFYAIGAVLILAVPSTSPSPEGIAAGVISLAGITITAALLLTGLLVGETDEAFADVYSGAVSLRNVFPRVDNRVLIVIVTIAGALAAGFFTMLAYELFLFLLGSVFIPLLGVWFADYFVLGNRSSGELRSFRFESLIGWISGFLLYHWIAPTPLDWWTSLVTGLVGEPLSTRVPWLGASIPAFMLAFLLHWVVGSMFRSTSEGGTGAVREGAR